MKDLYAKCGANCGRCPAYKENVKTEEAKQRCSEGWAKYLGFQTTPGRCYCDGCQTPEEENPVLLSSRCNIRKCAIKNGIETCARCSKYPCEELKASSNVNREWAEARIEIQIPEEDYLAFIEPYEGLKHLDQIRGSLRPEDFVEPKVPVANPRIVSFPEDLPFSKQETSAFKALHKILAILKRTLSNGSTYIQQEVLKERRQWIFRSLWTFGLFGKLEEEDGSHLRIDSEIFSEQKIPYWMDLQIVGRYFKTLKEHGVHCEHVPLTKEKHGKKGWLSPTGHLRKEGWFLKMFFDDKAGGASALKALKSYTVILNEKYGKKSYRYFSNLDMQVLSKD